MINCKNCGESLEGDGYTRVRHCPNAEGDHLDWAEPDAEVVYCEMMAEGEARAKLAIARAEAEAINLRGAALRDNPSLIDLTIAERWDGKLPTTNGGAIPLLNIK
jgi:hypothetical protein